MAVDRFRCPLFLGLADTVGLGLEPGLPKGPRLRPPSMPSGSLSTPLPMSFGENEDGAAAVAQLLEELKWLSSRIVLATRRQEAIAAEARGLQAAGCTQDHLGTGLPKGDTPRGDRSDSQVEGGGSLQVEQALRRREALTERLSALGEEMGEEHRRGEQLEKDVSAAEAARDEMRVSAEILRERLVELQTARGPCPPLVEEPASLHLEERCQELLIEEEAFEKRCQAAAKAVERAQADLFREEESRKELETSVNVLLVDKDHLERRARLIVEQGRLNGDQKILDVLEAHGLQLAPTNVGRSSLDRANEDAPPSEDAPVSSRLSSGSSGPSQAPVLELIRGGGSPTLPQGSRRWRSGGTTETLPLKQPGPHPRRAAANSDMQAEDDPSLPGTLEGTGKVSFRGTLGPSAQLRRPASRPYGHSSALGSGQIQS